ncbi:MAG TPA: FtsX-like permease family protein, partial [Burkholderiales bacterium]|nr:FtsX-like permease family protein [Burkholderiales bacterium]
LTLEPDRGVSFFNLAPRVLMNEADVPWTNLIQPGSRVTYAFYVAGEHQAIDDYTAWLKPQIGRGEELQSLDNARPEVKQTLERAQQFLGLTSLLAVVLAAVALSLATRRYVQRHMDSYAVLRCLGATQDRLLRLFAGEFLVLGVISCAIGCLLGYMAQWVLEYSLAKLVGMPLPQSSWMPAAQGFATGLVLLLGFALPPLLQLKNVPAVRVIRREVGLPVQSSLIAYGASLSAVAVLLLWQAGDVKLAAYTLAGFAGAFVLFALIAFVVLHALAWIGSQGSLAWRYGMASLRRRWRSNVVQVLALSLGLTAILLLGFSRGDLLQAWRSKTPVDAPNRFVLNIQPEQREPVLSFFADQELPAPELYPMVRGRLTAINGKPVNVDDYVDARTKRLAEREFNLSYMTTLPAHNRVSSGEWFGPGDMEAGALSVEEGIAERLGIQIGDKLDWTVGGVPFSAQVTNLRALDWDSMRVNFFVVTTPALLRDFPSSYITSFHVEEEKAAAMNKLTQRFPNLTVVDMSMVLKQVLGMMDQVVNAVQFVFLFALAAGLLVLYGALRATQDERVQEAAVMRALGATRAQVASTQRAEFYALGLLAGLLAAAGANAIAYVLALKVFELNYFPNPWLWLIGPLLGLACVSFNAWSGVRLALARPPMIALREV